MWIPCLSKASNVGRFFIWSTQNMKLNGKNIGIIAGIAAIVAAGVVWASNNVDAVEDTIG